MDVAANPTMVLELLLLGGLWFESVAFLFPQTTNNHFRLAFALAAIWSKTNHLIWRARFVYLSLLSYIPHFLNQTRKKKKIALKLTIIN